MATPLRGITSTFLNSLKALFPGNASRTLASSSSSQTSDTLSQPPDIPSQPSEYIREGLRNPWYIPAAVAFSASNRPEGVRRVFEHALADLRSANASGSPSRTGGKQEEEEEERLLARKMREALFKSGLICGYPRAINGLKALHEVMPEELKEEGLLRDPNMSLRDYEEAGNAFFKTVYGEKAEEVMAMLDVVYPDMGWFSRTIGYGLVYRPNATQTPILSPVETSYTLVAALIAMDTPQQIAWHLDGARRGGASVEEVSAVREVSERIVRAVREGGELSS